MSESTIARVAGRLALAAATSTLLFGAAHASPAQRIELEARRAPPSVEALRLGSPIAVDIDHQALKKIDPVLFGRVGSDTEEVLIQLREASVAEVVAAEASPQAQRSRGQSRRQQLRAEQSGFIARSQNRARRFEVTAQTQVVLNSVAAEVSTADLIRIAADPAVERISLVRHYERHLPETVPQIGASLPQALGYDGTGIRVAVLDSGVDYTHAALGGPGTPEAYAAAYGTNRLDAANTVRGDAFPTAKVVDGYDFVGELWPDLGPRSENPDPIAAPGGFGSHGTHVSDIIGGLNGVAPGVEIVGVKVCAAYASSCNGVALLLGMEFAVDPNGDGDTSDRVDIINMSLGANFGQDFDNALSQAVENASALGVLTVASAGNGSDNPFITGTPAAASSAISVAQTQVASAVGVNLMTVLEPAAGAGQYPAVYQPWSAPLTTAIEGPVTYFPPPDPRNLGCEPFAPGELDGQIVFVNRGVCAFSEKIWNISQAGGVLGIIGLVTPEVPFAGAYGGPELSPIPGFMISQAAGNVLRTGTAVVSFDPEVVGDFTARIVDTSSRGPRYRDSALKPEIGAPGGSVSAESGTGTGVSPFGGTSGAAPMVTGAAAILMQAYPKRSLAELKAVLMNTAEVDVVGDLAGNPAPISRIGAGEVRVDDALASTIAAWEVESLSGGVSFGMIDVADERVRIRKQVRIRNYSSRVLAYDLDYVFRDEAAEDTGAVEIRILPDRVTLPARKDQVVTVEMTIHGANLGGNFLNSGSSYSGANLTLNEFDGYIIFEPVEANRPKPRHGKKNWKSWRHAKQKHKGHGHKGPGMRATGTPISMPWHVLPRKAARVEASKPVIAAGGDAITLRNTGVGTAQNDAYSLLLTLPDQPRGGPGEGLPNPSVRAFGVQTYLVPDGFCSAPDGTPDYLMAFAFNLWERQAYSLWPGLAGVYLDVNGDGAPDYDVFNLALNYLGSTGDWRTVTVVTNLATGLSDAFFFTEHAHNSANQVLLVCDVQIGKQPFFANMEALVYVEDASFGSTFNTAPATFAPLGERYFSPDVPDLGAGQSGVMNVVDFGEAGTNPGELGLLLFTNGDRGAGARGGATPGTEAILLPEGVEEAEPDDGKGKGKGKGRGKGGR